MTITSHYRLNRSCATIILHHSRPAARMIPAPSYHQLSCRDHGTKVGVRDLFGNMPVRVKQRSLDFNDPKQRDRYSESLNKYLVGLLLAWGSAITISVQTGPGARVLYVRANEGQVPKIYKTPRTPSAVDIHFVRSVMSQAGHIGQSDWENWIHTSARNPLVSVEGAISVEPAPSKRSQFISIGINYIDNSPGYNILYDEINRLFAASSFGDDFEVLDKEQRYDNRRKQEGFTVQQLKGGGKGIDRWPMFFLRIATNNKEELNYDGAGSNHHERNFLSTVTKVVTAMIVRFLEDHHFLTQRMSQNIRPRETKGRNHKPVTNHIERLPSPTARQHSSQTPTSEQRSPRDLRGPEQSRSLKKTKTSTSMAAPRRVETKLPNFKISRDSGQVRAFATWQRIKSGNFKDLLELRHDSSVQNITKDGAIQNPHDSSTRTSDSGSISKSHRNGKGHLQDYSSEERTSLVPSSGSDNVTNVPDEPVVPEVPPISQPTETVDTCSNDDTVQWTNPCSKATVLINARTGLAIPQVLQRGIVGGGAPLQGRTVIRGLNSSRNENRLSLGISDSLSAPHDAKWVNDILTNWKNPTFSMTEERIPQISFDGLNMESSANLHRRHPRCSYTDKEKTFMESSLSSQTKLSKQGLAAARVIAQVDKKFILVSIDNDIVRGSENERKEKKILALVDQHAADERIRVEKLFEELCTPLPLQDQQSICGMGYGDLVSAIMTTVLAKKIVFETRISERKLFVGHASRFADWGILYDISPSQHPSGPSAPGKCRITVKTLPECIAEKCRIDPNSLIGIMRSEVWNCQHPGYTKASSSSAQSKNEKAPGWLSRIGDCPKGILEMLNSRACRSAIMFNDELSTEQCESLVQRLGACAFPFQCAHGRPSMIPLVDLSAQLVSCDSDTAAAFGTRRVGGADGEERITFAAAWKRREDPTKSHGTVIDRSM